MIDKVLKFLDDGIPKNDFDRQLLASNLVGATNLIELNKREREITLKKQLKLQLNPIKGNFDYNFVPGKELDKYSKIIFDELAKNNYLKNSKDLNHFAKNLAKFMGEINALHPFREGNGRTQRIFLNELAKNAGYKLDLNLISKHKMIHACAEASQLKPGRLEALIKDNLKNFRQNLDLEQNKGISL